MPNLELNVTPVYVANPLYGGNPMYVSDSFSGRLSMMTELCSIASFANIILCRHDYCVLGGTGQRLHVDDTHCSLMHTMIIT